MSLTRLARAVVSYGVGATLALQGLGVLVPSVTHAASPELRISEINWAGSSSSAADEWIELVNTSLLPIVFTDATPYKLVVGTAPAEVTYDLDSTYGTLLPGQYLVIHRLPLSTSTLRGSGTAEHHFVGTLDLPNAATEYKVYADDGTMTDMVGDAGTGTPFKGTAATATTQVASMSRIDLAGSGSNPANWFTAHTIGRGFDANTLQYGTPYYVNAEVDAPTAVITPAGSVTLPALPQVSGTASAPAVRVEVTFTRVSHDPSPTPFSRQYLAPVVAPDYNYTVTAGPDLQPGRYIVEVQAVDASNNRSAVTRVPNTAGGTEYEYEVLPSVSTVPTPVLNALPAVTNQPSVVVSGTLDTATSYHSLEVLRNNVYYGTFAVSGSTFSFPVILLPNQTNVVKVVGVTTNGDFSVPASATIVHDSVAPNKVDLTKVVLTANNPGSDDSFIGNPGAAEPETTLFVYADSAQTQLIGMVMVGTDGSFPRVNLGDNKYENVYLVLQDAAGNRSAAAVLMNPVTFTPPAGTLNPQVESVQTTQATITWTPVPGVTKYRVVYRTANGTFGAPMDVCGSTGNTNCVFRTTINNLFTDTNYVFAIAAVDQYGNVSPYSEVTFKTKAAEIVGGVGGVPASSTGQTVASTTSRSTDRVVTSRGPVASKATPAPTASPSPSPSASPEAGDVKSESTTSRNWTPWIVLGALVALAVLATAGYFYWFGGSAGEAALASVMAERARREEEETKANKSGASKSKKTGSKDRRW
ncbi:MAG TPA: fibronectin type III domain-containing protein [Verrucomicrobiae bacterium]|nr:fibronectin type III domain-containing protein [Verrucomicrobiae bacterium]